MKRGAGFGEMCGQISARKARKAGKARTARHKTENQNAARQRI